jgi:hypothetical protein
MERQWVQWCGLVAGVGIVAFANSGCRRAIAAEPKPSSVSGPVSLTVYKDDFGMVSEQRPVSLESGSNRLRLGSVSNQLDPNSVMFDAPRGTRVVATTYDLGVGNTQNLIQRLSGKEVELIWASTDGHEGERIKGTLEPAADGGFLLRSGDRIYINPAGTLVAAADSDVATLPGLSVQVQSEQSEKQNLGVSYLTRGLSWSADYVAHLDSDNARLDLECWASVVNRTGVPFQDAQIAFVAGSPNRAVRSRTQRYEMAGEAAKTEAPMEERQPQSAGVAPKAIGELYQYKPKDRATIGVDQISRVRMFDGNSIPVRLDYSVRLPEMYAWGGWNSQTHLNAQLAVELDNRSSSGLGIPMPSGAIRIFQRDGKEDRYTGADTIGDIPADGHISLALSKVFDVTAEPTVLSSKRIDKHTVRKALRVLLRNAKDRDVEVRLVQDLYGKWTVAAGDPGKKLSASTIEWTVRVPSHSTATLDTTLDLKD